MGRTPRQEEDEGRRCLEVIRTPQHALPASKHGPRISRWKLNSYSEGLVASLSSSWARQELLPCSGLPDPQQGLALRVRQAPVNAGHVCCVPRD